MSFMDDMIFEKNFKNAVFDRLNSVYSIDVDTYDSHLIEYEEIINFLYEEAYNQPSCEAILNYYQGDCDDVDDDCIYSYFGAMTSQAFYNGLILGYNKKKDAQYSADKFQLDLKHFGEEDESYFEDVLYELEEEGFFGNFHTIVSLKVLSSDFFEMYGNICPAPMDQNRQKEMFVFLFGLGMSMGEIL